MSETFRALACPFRPSSINGSATFSSAVRVGIRLNDWNTSPMFRRRNSVSCWSSIVPMSVPLTITRPESGRARPAIRCSSVLLPDPLAPMTAMNRPWATSMLIPSNALTRRSPWRNCLTALSTTSGAIQLNPRKGNPAL